MRLRLLSLFLIPFFPLFSVGRNPITGDSVSAHLGGTVLGDSTGSDTLAGGSGPVTVLSEVRIRALPDPESSVLSDLDLGLRNVQSGQELLQLSPGLFIAQHAGGGKAEQLFFRGFDLDHGTDLSLRVDGIPVNMVSHAHGQGYSDLHFLIPETVGKVRLQKGPHEVSEGNFATAGALQLQTLNRLDKNVFRTEVGSFGTLRSLAMLQLPVAPEARVQGYVAGEFLGSRGYFEQPQELKRVNVFGKVSWEMGPRTLVRGTLSWFQSSWMASGQIPLRAVQSGMIDRFGAIDPTEGGQTGRRQASISVLHTLPDQSFLRQQAYLVSNDFQLYSNFTFFLERPTLGDRIRQTERRWMHGYQGSWEKRTQLAGLGLRHQIGWGFRADRVNDLELAWAPVGTESSEPIQLGKVREWNNYLYASEELSWHQDWSLDLGVRYDHFVFGYRDDLVASSGTERGLAGRLSPKLKLAWTPRDDLRTYLRLSRGFHSNDSRSGYQNPGQALPVALGADLGLVWQPAPRWLVQAGLWRLDLEQELVYVGDAGIVEATGASRRMGLDLSLRWEALPGLVASGDLNYAHARYKDGSDNRVPLAPILSSSGGLHGRIARQWWAGLGYRYLMDRPADEAADLEAEGFFLVQSSLQWQPWEYLRIGLQVDNLLNQSFREAQFATTSQLAGESEPVTEIHFTPGAPRSIRLQLGLTF